MLRFALLLAAFFCTAAFADARADAIGASVLDCLTTGEALAGEGGGALRELNPRGPILACALKLPAVAFADSLPEPERTSALHAQRSVWDGAAANNLAALLGVSGPASAGVGFVVAYIVWEGGAEEREFMRLCAVHRRLSGNPVMRCNYTPTTSSKGNDK